MSYFLISLLQKWQRLTAWKEKLDDTTNQSQYGQSHGLLTPNEGTNQRYLKNWADVAHKICFGRT
jgi:hypothetical protein